MHSVIKSLTDLKKNPSKVHGRPMGFNVTGCRKCINNGFRFHIAAIF